MPKASPAGLNALLMTGEFVCCDLYAFLLSTGGGLYYTTSDFDVAYAGNTYISHSALFDSYAAKSRAHWKVGLDVDTWQVSVAPLEVDEITGAAFPAKIGSVPWLAAVVGGALDGAVVDIHRAYWTSWPAPQPSPPQPQFVLVDLFAGPVAGVDVFLLSGSAVISINSHLGKLTQQMPRNLYQSGCRHTLFDAACSLVKSNFAFSTFIATGTVGNTIYPNGTIPTSYNYTLGQMTFTTGANAGLSRMIKVSTPTYFLVDAPFPFDIALGDNFTMYPGCDKTFKTCINTFVNRANFGGQPDIPVPETAV
jgi:hypothetical protein